jgi:pilus assembly protein CpaD
MAPLPALRKRRLFEAAMRAFAIGGLAMTLAGCYQTGEKFVSYPADYRERHPITLRDGERTVEVFLGRNRGGLSPAQRADVMAFAAAWKNNATSGVVIDVPNGGPTKQAAADSLREIHSILNASGIPGNGVRVRPYLNADLALPSIKLSYARLMAEAGPCGRWPYDLGPESGALYQANRPHWNQGCSTQRNLSAMVDNPTDLVQPRGESPAYMARRSVAIDNYRKGLNPSGTYTGYDTGKISDLGK